MNMRMWMIFPFLLCDIHLKGEHYEFHKWRHIFEKHYKIDGRIEPIVQIEPMSMKTRHDELEEEMRHRGMNANSPFIMPDLSYLENKHRLAKVDPIISIKELWNRCPACKERIIEFLSDSVPITQSTWMSKLSLDHVIERMYMEALGV